MTRGGALSCLISMRFCALNQPNTGQNSSKLPSGVCFGSVLVHVVVSWLKRTTLIWDKVYGFSSYQYLKTFLSFSSHLIFVLVLVSCSHPALSEQETKRKRKKLSERERKRLIYFETVKNNNLILPTYLYKTRYIFYYTNKIESTERLQELKSLEFSQIKEALLFEM